MTFSEAAAYVLQLVGKPLHYKEITDIAIEASLLSHVGKSPEVTMGARLAAQVKKNDKENPLVRLKPGVFALSAWDEKTVEAGLADRTPPMEAYRKAAELASKDAPEADAEAGSRAKTARVTPVAFHKDIKDAESPPDEEEQHRRELSAGATDLFDAEDDDDQPIFGGSETNESVETDGEQERADTKRRRRRRRGRRGREEDDVEESSEDLPTYTVSDADPEELPSEPVHEEAVFSSGDAPSGETLAALLFSVLERYDRQKGPVAVQNVADALRRRIKADIQVNVQTVLGIAHADNLAADRAFRPRRFRVSGGKLALASWNQDRRALERERALFKAAEQVAESTVRAVSEELRRLPQRAVGDLLLVLLDRMGLSRITSIRRQGAHGSEMHATGSFKQGGVFGAGRTQTAIVIRRDGKDIGREQVTELRGALHHYGGAGQGWILTTGQVLSGAREEAASASASPIVLLGRAELAELCVTHGVGVRIQQLEVPALDFELFENLQGR